MGGALSGLDKPYIHTQTCHSILSNNIPVKLKHLMPKSLGPEADLFLSLNIVTCQHIFFYSIFHATGYLYKI
jgi:hypothetical protein